MLLNNDPGHCTNNTDGQAYLPDDPRPHASIKSPLTLNTSSMCKYSKKKHMDHSALPGFSVSKLENPRHKNEKIGVANQLSTTDGASSFDFAIYIMQRFRP